MSRSIGDITLSATARRSGLSIGLITCSAQVTVGALPVRDGLPTQPAHSWWWHQYVSRITGERAAAREALARHGAVFGIAPLPFAEAYAEHAHPPIGTLAAVAPAPTAHADGFVSRLVMVIDHATPADDEALALLGAAMLAA